MMNCCNHEQELKKAQKTIKELTSTNECFKRMFLKLNERLNELENTKTTLNKTLCDQLMAKNKMREAFSQELSAKNHEINFLTERIEKLQKKGNMNCINMFY